jgi:hypothetical protein
MYAKPTIAMVNGWCFGGGFSPLAGIERDSFKRNGWYVVSRQIVPFRNLPTRRIKSCFPAPIDRRSHQASLDRPIRLDNPSKSVVSNNSRAYPERGATTFRPGDSMGGKYVR